MADKNEKVFENLISDVKTTIIQAQYKLDKRGIKISEVDLELKVTAKDEGEAGIKFQFPMTELKFEATGKRKQEDINSITISLVPKLPEIELLSSPKDELNNMVERILAAVDEAVREEPAFILAEAVAELNFKVTDTGKAEFSIFAKAGGEINRDAIQTMKLKLQGPGKERSSESSAKTTGGKKEKAKVSQ